MKKIAGVGKLVVEEGLEVVWESFVVATFVFGWSFVNLFDLILVTDDVEADWRLERVDCAKEEEVTRKHRTIVGLRVDPKWLPNGQRYRHCYAGSVETWLSFCKLKA